jgi:hypothetical protein
MAERHRKYKHDAQASELLRWCGFTRLRVVLVLSFALLIGCTKQHTTNTPQSTSVARTTLQRGPVTITVEASPEPARLSDEPTLTLTIDYEQGVEVEPPPFGEAMGDFIIRDFREPLPESRNDRTILRQIYTLEPTTTGALQIDPITITFKDTRPDGDGESHAVETEAIILNVLSVVASEAPSLDDLENFAAPVDLPPSRAWIAWSAGTTVGLLLVTAVIAWIIVRRKNKTVEKQLTPRELANRELDRLWNDRASRHNIKIFYVRLTAIVREYIEGTTGVHAPEQTTEEFLREIGAGDRFLLEERQRLGEFLEAADLVKFARVRPELSDVEESYQRAKRFVEVAGEE